MTKIQMPPYGAPYGENKPHLENKNVTVWIIC